MKEGREERREKREGRKEKIYLAGFLARVNKGSLTKKGKFPILEKEPERCWGPRAFFNIEG
jgi:hypothetical protein